MHGRVLLGVTASVAGSVGHSLGMTLQKRAHMQEDAHTGSSNNRRRVWRNRQWQVGLLLYLVSSTVPPTIALSMLPVFVAAPLAAVGLVANAVFAQTILASSFVQTDVMGTVLVAAGSGLVALFGAIDEPPLDLGQLLRLFRRRPYVVFFGVYTAVVVLLISIELCWRRRYISLQRRRETAATVAALGSEPQSLAENTPTVLLATVDECLDTETQPLMLSRTALRSPSTTTYLLDTTDSSPHTMATRGPTQHDSVGEMYREHFYMEDGALEMETKTPSLQRARYASGFLSAVVSGLICSQTLLLAKSGIGLILLSVHGSMQLNNPLTLAIAFGLVATALANLYYIQHALSMCSTLTVVPLCYCSSSLAALLSSLVYFDQLRLLGALQIMMIAIGIVLLAVGVLLLSLKAEPCEGPLHLTPDPSD
ncbi:hypothetical protein COEREDRAFT_79183 [Coemansia reversa NRRL 1564]|uniref:Uncharacterized protein n=1 Tax=Coemansia reversa (strain ATCC 12441 / NRRL 1564) TaxID=763665 RepID=A0A2G5BJQ0_COERN|nr:hypothetical protein COEREDRAFT_79183 [Coemansia reversa NRRL 1564]|eukprot:PIA19229.1 hypothetical protein COEREDRAFT_79183 [Coemansia reversa NRRL 1564]